MTRGGKGFKGMFGDERHGTRAAAPVPPPPVLPTEADANRYCAMLAIFCVAWHHHFEYEDSWLFATRILQSGFSDWHLEPRDQEVELRKDAVSLRLVREGSDR